MTLKHDLDEVDRTQHKLARFSAEGDSAPIVAAASQMPAENVSADGSTLGSDNEDEPASVSHDKKKGADTPRPLKRVAAVLDEVENHPPGQGFVKFPRAPLVYVSACSLCFGSCIVFH